MALIRRDDRKSPGEGFRHCCLVKTGAAAATFAVRAGRICT
jgi:hypothetical protein